MTDLISSISWIEIGAVVFALAYLVLAIRQSVLCWPSALISVSLSLVLFYGAKLYMEAALQVFYIAMAVYGWYQWRHGGTEHRGVKITLWSRRAHVIAIAAVIVLSAGFGALLSARTDAALPYADSFTTIGALVATYMVTKKVLENWAYWFVLDSVSVFVYVARELYLYALLFVLYLVLIVIGYRRWHLDFGAKKRSRVPSLDMRDAAPDRERISRALAALLGSSAKNVAPRKLGGGLGHVSYLVALPEQSFVLRLKADSAGATLGLEEEFTLLGALAAAEITAEPLGMDVATGALLIRFVPGAQALTEAAAREPANIRRIAALLRRLHGIQAVVRDFAPRRHAERYFAALGRGAPLASREQRMVTELRKRVADYASRYPPSAVCHNDLAAANILDAGDLVLVDFEYAARAAPILDLASLAAMNDFGYEDLRELLRAYYGSSRPPVSPGELASVVRLVKLMAHFWARALPEEHRAQNVRYLQV